MLKNLSKIQRDLRQSDFAGCGCRSNELWIAFNDTYKRNLLETFDNVDMEARAFLENLVKIKSEKKNGK